MWIWDLDISALTILPLAPGTHPRAVPGPIPRRQSRAGFPIRTYPFPRFPSSLRLSLSFSCLFYRLAFDHARALSRFLSWCGGEFTWFQFVALICRCSCNGMFFCCVTHVDFGVTSHTKVNRYHACWRLLLLGVRLINRGLDANSSLSLSLAAATVAADACYFLWLCGSCKRPTSDIGTKVLSSVRYQTWYRADDNRSKEAWSPERMTRTPGTYISASSFSLQFANFV